MEKESTVESVELRSSASGSSGDQKSTSSEPRMGVSVRGVGVFIQPQERIFGEKTENVNTISEYMIRNKTKYFKLRLSYEVS